VETFTVGSLFSGIGGLDLGLERAGMRVIWQSEIDPYACRVLAKHWPDVPNLGNIKEIDWSKCEQPDVICGGYPCQPFSTAGKRRGQEDPRHLWPWVRDAISELRPRYAILENVRGHLSMGGLSVVGELASIGYDAEWRVVSAASVGANHRRDRVIIVAYPNDARPHRAEIDATETGEPSFGGLGGCGEDVANSNNSGGGTSRSIVERAESACKQQREHAQHGFSGCGEDVAYPTVYGGDGRRFEGCIQQSATDWVQSTLRRSGGYSGHTNWETEPDVGRVADGIPHRVDRLRGLGNAVVPQVAEVIGRLVVEHARWKHSSSRSTSP